MAIDEPGMEGELPRDSVRWLVTSQGAATEMARARETQERMGKTRGRGNSGEAGQTRDGEAASEAGGQEVTRSRTSEAGHRLTLGLIEGLELGELVM